MIKELEDRYIVFKVKHLSEDDLVGLLDYIHAGVDCVVIEKDWPEYRPTVDLLLKRINE